MCPSFSCCYLPATNRPTTPLYYLARLRLAAGTAELLPHQLPALDMRTEVLWQQFRYEAQHRLRVPARRAQPLAEQLLEQLLSRPCCCRSLRRAVSLAEAMGPLAYGDWFALEAWAA